MIRLESAVPVVTATGRRHRRAIPGSGIAAPTAAVTVRLAGLAAIAVGFFLSYLGLLSLVSFPFERYFVGAVIFLPSTLCAMLFVLWRRILTAW